MRLSNDDLARIIGEGLKEYHFLDGSKAATIADAIIRADADAVAINDADPRWDALAKWITYAVRDRTTKEAIFAKMDSLKAQPPTQVAAPAPDMIHTVVVKIAADKTPTAMDIITYAGRRIAQTGTVGPLAVVGNVWASAMVQFVAQNPDPIIRLFRDELERRLISADAIRNARVSGCSGSLSALGDDLKEAEKIHRMLDFLASELGDSRVWGEQAAEAQTSD